MFHLRIACLMLADAICIGFFWLLATLGYWAVAKVGYHPVDYIRIWPIIPLYVGINILFRLYHGSVLHPSLPQSPSEELRRLFCSSILTHVLVMAVLGFSRQELDWSRLIMVLSGFCVAVFSQSFRGVARVLMRKAGVGQIRMVLMGSGAVAWEIANGLSSSSYYGISVVGYFGREKESCGLSIPRLGDIRDAVKVSRRLGVRRLLFCEDQRIYKCQMRELTTWFTQIEYFPELSAFPILGARPLSVEGLGGLEMVNLTGMRSILLQKKLLDWGFSIIAAIVSVPLIGVLAILIKLTSRGPVFYRQHRLGQGGRPFKIWKFRTMYMDADRRLKDLLKGNSALKKEWKTFHKLANDPRVTSFGKFLRRTSLDELPQIINVFAGEMSLIGPRPIVEDEVAYYGDRYAVFARAKPGITGLWQSKGRSDTDYARRVSLDVYYVLNWNIWLDLWILKRTVGTVLMMKGAR